MPEVSPGILVSHWSSAAALARLSWIVEVGGAEGVSSSEIPFGMEVWIAPSSLRVAWAMVGSE